LDILTYINSRLAGATKLRGRSEIRLLGLTLTTSLVQVKRTRVRNVPWPVHLQLAWTIIEFEMLRTEVTGVLAGASSPQMLPHSAFW